MKKNVNSSVSKEETSQQFTAIDFKIVESLDDVEVVKKLLIKLSQENFNLRQKIIDLYLKNGVIK